MSGFGLKAFQIMNYTDGIWFLWSLEKRKQKLMLLIRAEMLSYNPFYSFPFQVLNRFCELRFFFVEFRSTFCSFQLFKKSFFTVFYAKK